MIRICLLVLFLVFSFYAFLFEEREKGMRVEWMSHSRDEHNLFNRHEIVVDCIVTGRVLQYWSSLSLHLFFCIIWMPIQNIKYVNVYLMNFSLLLCVYQKRFRPGTWKNSPSTKMQTLWLPCIAVLVVLILTPLQIGVCSKFSTKTCYFCLVFTLNGLSALWLLFSKNAQLDKLAVILENDKSWRKKSESQQYLLQILDAIHKLITNKRCKLFFKSLSKWDTKVSYSFPWKASEIWVSTFVRLEIPFHLHSEVIE